MTDVSLDGRTAIVTGAGSGIGRAEALGLAAAGASVVINDVDGNVADDTAAAIRAAGGRAVTSVGDIGEWSTAEAMVATALREFGRLDALVNNAGVVRDKMIFSMSPEDFDLVVRTHMRGHFLTSRVATAYWRDQSKEAGGEVYARIINTSSEAFLLGSTGQPNYAAAKGGIAALTVTIARSCARYGVRANAILPRARTAMVGGLLGEAPTDGPDPLSAEYVAPLVTYLASPAAANINGELFLVHGGVAAVIAPPTVSATFLAKEHGSPDGMWTLDAIASALAGFATTNPEGAGFFCGETLAMADETIGFSGGQ